MTQKRDELIAQFTPVLFGSEMADAANARVRLEEAKVFQVGTELNNIIMKYNDDFLMDAMFESVLKPRYIYPTSAV